MKIELLLCPYREEVRLLVSIPEIQKDTTEIILAEIGMDMPIFPSEGHLALWVGLSLSNNESAVKKKYTHK